MSGLRKSLRPLKRFYRRYIYRRWDLIIAVRDNRKPLYDIPRVSVDMDTVTVAMATAADAHYFDNKQWRHLHAKFKDRIANLEGFGTIMGIIDGKLVSQGPFVVGRYYDEVMRYHFDPGERGAYWFEGETAADWRSRGLALVGMNHVFEWLLKEHGCTSIMTYYLMGNRASRKLHDRYSFEPQHRLIWRQLGPFKWTRQTPLPSDF